MGQTLNIWATPDGNQYFFSISRSFCMAGKIDLSSKLLEMQYFVKASADYKLENFSDLLTWIISATDLQFLFEPTPSKWDRGAEILFDANWISSGREIAVQGLSKRRYSPCFANQVNDCVIFIDIRLVNREPWEEPWVMEIG